MTPLLHKYHAIDFACCKPELLEAVRRRYRVEISGHSEGWSVRLYTRGGCYHLGQAKSPGVALKLALRKMEGA